MNLTIQQALKATSNQFQELEFCGIRGNIIENLETFICAGIRHKYFYSRRQLFFLLIMAERCVVLVYQKSGDIIAVLDSHSHSIFGNLF